ncbi:MAG: ABC transporter ATP-binding protein [Clostridia bacterium]|nr:ABC transporter ATP-binding protein [Clostridia bacterium]
MNIEIRDIKKRYGRKEVLKGVSFAAESGECIGILGENGSGKSTLFSVLCGLQRGDGSFMLDGGEDLMKNSRLRSRTVGFVPQEPPLMAELSAKDNLRLWYSGKAIREGLSGGVLELLGIGEFLSVTVSKMSGGMKKRLSIGCSVANDPKVLLLDEPTGALDLVCKKSIAEYLSDFCKKGGIAIIASHDVYELEACDRLYVLKGGTLTLHEGKRDVDTLAELLL